MNSSANSGDIMLLSGNSHPALAQLVAERLGIRLGACLVYQKTNRETMVEILESVRSRTVYIMQTGVHKLGCEQIKVIVGRFANNETQVEILRSLRGRNVYILQTGGTRDVNNAIMELLVMVYACKTSSARSVIGVIPFMPYSKQSKMRKRGCIVSKLLARMMCTAGLTHVITVDLHQKEVQGFFDCPVDNLRASPFLLQYIREQIPDYRNAVIVAKDPASCKRATSYAERLRIGIAVIHGEAKTAEFIDDDLVDENDAESAEVDDGRTSPPPARARINPSPRQPSSASISQAEVDPSRIMSIGLNVVPMQAAKEKPPISVVGDVGGRIAIMVDDIIDDVSSFTAAAEMLRERGAYKIYVLATHGLLSADAPRLIEESDIDEVVVTNTIPHELQKIQCHKIKTIDVSILFTEAIRRLHHQESLSYLFRNISTED